MSKKTYAPLTDEQATALRKYAHLHGHYWKAQLEKDWLRASATPELHQLRNTHGPLWLKGFKF